MPYELESHVVKSYSGTGADWHLEEVYVVVSLQGTELLREPVDRKWYEAHQRHDFDEELEGQAVALFAEKLASLTCAVELSETIHDIDTRS